MAPLNWIAILSTSLIPLIVGFIYYSDQVFGSNWMRINGFTKENLQGGNMALVTGLTLLLGLVLSTFFIPTVLHASHVMSLIAVPGSGSPDPNGEAFRDATAFLGKYGGNFRTFKHGALHGVIAALFCVWPVLGINAIFERRGWKYTAVHLGYWVIVFALMGGVVCAYA